MSTGNYKRSYTLLPTPMFGFRPDPAGRRPAQTPADQGGSIPGIPLTFQPPDHEKRDQPCQHDAEHGEAEFTGCPVVEHDLRTKSRRQQRCDPKPQSFAKCIVHTNSSSSLFGQAIHPVHTNRANYIYFYFGGRCSNQRSKNSTQTITEAPRAPNSSASALAPSR